MTQPHIILDFDSTFIQGETLDELAAVISASHHAGPQLQQQIAKITQDAMSGSIDFSEALQQRVRMLEIQPQHIEQVIKQCKTRITKSIADNRQFIRDNAAHIYIFSGGFEEIIVPVVADFGISAANVFANRFVYGSDGTVCDVDASQFMAQDQGKIKQLRALNLHGDVYVIGDGYTDLEMQDCGLVTQFFLFVENVKRENLLSKANQVINSFDQFIKIL